MKKVISESLSFDDVLIVPQLSNIRSRGDVDISTVVGGYKLSLPIISSPMDTVTESKMAIALGKAGGLGIIHRFMSIEQQMDEVSKVILARSESGQSIPVAYAIGVGSAEFERYLAIQKKFGTEIDFVAIDIANGHSSLMKDMISSVKGSLSGLGCGQTKIIAGNVATGEGWLYLAKAGADCVRVGVGGGFICKTRIMTGAGVPTFASVLEADGVRQENAKFSHVSILADGGIRYPADLAKSLAAGADAIICGKILAGSDEAPTLQVVEKDGVNYKTYRGMASEEIQKEKRGGLKKGTCAEGVSTFIKCTGPLENTLNDFAGGLKSSFTYVDATNLIEYKENTFFTKITEAGLSESHAFGTRV